MNFLNKIFGFEGFTKENLSTEDLIIGLLDHGLFSNKVPPCFTSHGLAEAAKELLQDYINEENETPIKKHIEKHSNDYIRYEALRDTNIPRHLGIPHPASYAIQVFSIARHWDLITTHCNRPNPQFSQIHVQHTGDGRIFEMNYKGSDRYKKEETELEWMTGAKYVVKADIATCFPSIYTHSIPWALHSKGEAKKSTNLIDLPGNLLDKVTQNIKDKQTNGLLIGPHSSNVISEIILTRIDLNLQDRDYKNIFRHIDDYTFYAKTYDEAELFIKDLGMFLREYEMSLNEKKTQILQLPRPSTENWIQRLNTFNFPKDEELRISTIRSYLDLALEYSQNLGKSTPLNYAIKSLSGGKEDRLLNNRAKKMYSQEAINLALAYPYLAPLLDKFVFQKYPYSGQSIAISKFCTELIKLGLKKLYPDSIAHAIYYSIRYNARIELDDNQLIDIIKLNDCLSIVLLFEYANYIDSDYLRNKVNDYAQSLKPLDKRDIGRNWLLIYQLWTDNDLNGNGQSFLLKLRNKGVKFISFPEPSS
jgi:hypothetical protein